MALTSLVSIMNTWIVSDFQLKRFFLSTALLFIYFGCSFMYCIFFHRVWSDESLNSSESPDHDHLSFYESPLQSPFVSHYGHGTTFYRQPYMDHNFPELSKPFQNMWKLVTKRELSKIITRLTRPTLASKSRQKRPNSERLGGYVKQGNSIRLSMTPNGAKEFRSFR